MTILGCLISLAYVEHIFLAVEAHGTRYLSSAFSNTQDVSSGYHNVQPSRLGDQSWLRSQPHLKGDDRVSRPYLRSETKFLDLDHQKTLRYGAHSNPSGTMDNASLLA